MTLIPLTTDATTWRILIVDDEMDNLNLAADFLEFSGAQTTKARSGDAALALIDTFKPNLILLDLGMPRMDGWEVQRRLRALPEVDPVPIIALTALAMRGDAEKVRTAGFDGYVTKPFRVKALLAEILACIEAFAHKSGVPLAPAPAPASNNVPDSVQLAPAPSADLTPVAHVMAYRWCPLFPPQRKMNEHAERLANSSDR